MCIQIYVLAIDFLPEHYLQDPGFAKKQGISLYADDCFPQEAEDAVKQLLDSGVLHKICARLVQSYFNPMKNREYTCHGYTLVMLGACAMSHG